MSSVGDGTSGRTRLALESLECRLLLDGTVFVAVSGGNLVLTGDEYDNAIGITEDVNPGDYIITSLDGTLIDTGTSVGTDPVLLTGVTKDVKMKMGDGDDFVSLVGDVPANVKFDGGTGENTLYVFNSLIPGSLQVKNKEGGGYLQVGYAGVGGKLSFSNGVTGGQGGVADLYSVGINGGIQVKNKGGYSIFSMEDFATTSIKVNNGGNGSTTLLEGYVDSKVEVKNKAGFADTSLSYVDVYGGLKITNGDGGSSTVIVGDYGVGGAVGADGWYDEIEGGISIKNGAGYDTFYMEEMDVYGTTSVSNGSGGSSTEIVWSETDDVLITNGAGTDATTIDDVDVYGDLAINNGEGDSYVHLTSEPLTVEIWGDLIVTNGTGYDEFEADYTWVGGDVTINNGQGDSETDFEDMDVDGSIALVNGSGYDDLYVSVLDTGGSVTITNGDGGSDVDFYAGGDSVGGNLTITSGSGTDRVDVTSSSIGGLLTVNTGAGDDDVDLYGSDAYGVSVDTGDGDDEADLNDVDVWNSLTVQMGAGDDELDAYNVWNEGASPLVLDGGAGYDGYYFADDYLDDYILINFEYEIAP